MVVGTTEPQDFQLLDDGNALVGTGFTPSLAWHGTTPAGSPTITWLDQAAGIVRVSNVGTMAVGVYQFRVRLTDGGGKIGFLPNLQHLPDTWRVVRV
jgi:hypothetical protein